MGTFSDLGYERTRLNEFQQLIEAEYKLIFGDNIDLSGDSQDGQIVAIMSEIFANLDEGNEFIFKSHDPNQAQGTPLSTLLTLIGTTRKDESKSKVGIDVTGTNGTVIVAGKIVKTQGTEEKFTIDSDITIAGGVGSGTATAVNSGAIKADAGTLTIIDTPVTGWVSVTNPLDADLGQLEETDQEARIRYSQSTSRTGRNMVDTLRALLLEIEDVSAEQPPRSHRLF